MAGVGSLTNPTNQTTGLPINSLISGNTPQTPAQTGNGSPLGQDAFLKLLTTELQNQDPLNPMDDTQSVTQLAQFQALSSQVNLANSFQSFQAGMQLTQAAGLIGHTVSVNATNPTTGGSSTVTGKIAGVSVVNGTPQFALTDSKGRVIVDANGNPMTFQLSQITGIVQ